MSMYINATLGLSLLEGKDSFQYIQGDNDTSSIASGFACMKKGEPPIKIVGFGQVADKLYNISQLEEGSSKDFLAIGELKVFKAEDEYGEYSVQDSKVVKMIQLDIKEIFEPSPLTESSSGDIYPVNFVEYSGKLGFENEEEGKVGKIGYSNEGENFVRQGVCVTIGYNPKAPKNERTISCFLETSFFNKDADKVANMNVGSEIHIRKGRISYNQYTPEDADTGIWTVQVIASRVVKGRSGSGGKRKSLPKLSNNVPLPPSFG